MDTAIHSISTRIAALRTRAARTFIDSSGIPDLFAHNEIPAILKECGAEPHQVLNYGNIIRTKAPKLFTVLIWIQQPLLILTFIEHGIYDDKLPLEQTTIGHMGDACHLNPLFFDTQYECIPHFFEKGIHSRIHDDRVILPFDTIERLPELDGSFGSICKVSICPSFHNLTSGTVPREIFVRKEIKIRRGPNSVGSFDTEKRNLALLHCLKHPNIVELLCSYSVKEGAIDRHFLLFPQEPMDLHQFLSLPEPFGLFSQEATFYLALQGLASALHCIHDFKLDEATHAVEFKKTGSHRDIRPQNILVRPDTFVIADFGLSDFKDPLDERGSQTLWKAGRGDYIAPECYGDAFDRQIVGRSLDVWAFGCMIVDIATYMQTGSHGLAEFKTRRNGPWRDPIKNGFFFHKQAMKPANLRQQYNQPAFFQLLSLAESMLDMRPQQRATAQEIWTSMNHICTVKLFNQMIAELENYNEFLTSRAEIGPSQATLWFELERLMSWADILSLLEDQTPGPPSNKVAVETHSSQNLLRELDSLVKIQHTRMNEILRRDGNEQQLASLHLSFQNSLSDYVQKLFDILPARLQKRADNWWTNRLLHTGADERLATYTSESWKSRNKSYQKLGRRALVKKNLMAISECRESALENSQLHLDPERISDVCAHGKHTYGHYNTGNALVRVLIETTFVGAKGVTTGQMALEETNIRKLALAKLFATPDKPSDFHVLDCMGFIDKIDLLGEWQADFVYALADDHHGESIDGRYVGAQESTFDRVPQTLLEVLNVPLSREFSGIDTPPLEDRVKLAQVLVSSIHSLHLNGWLHKSFSSSNVLIFQSLTGNHDFARPRIVGFKNSRPDGDIWKSLKAANDSSLDGYMHPDYKLNDQDVLEADQVRFRRVYDYFSVGIVLLEVGLWRSLQSMMSKLKNDRPNTLRNILLAKYSPRLHSLVGSAYARATIKCLKTDFQSERPGDGAEGQLNEFYVNVVEPILEMRI